MMWTKVVLAAMVFGIASSSPRVRRDTPEDAGIPPSGDAVSRFRAGEGGNAKTPGIPLPRKLVDVSLRRGRADVSLRGEIGVRPLRGGHADVSPTRGQDELSISGGHADASPRRGHAGVSLRGRLADVSLRREHADVSPIRGQDDLSIQGGHADASPKRGHAGVSLRGRHVGVSLRRGHADVSPSRGQEDLSISDGHADVSLTEVQNDLGTSGGNADVSLRRGQNDLGHRRGHADVSLSRGQDDLGLRREHAVSLSRGQDDLSLSGGHQPITLHESQAGVTSSRGASVTPSSTLSSSSGSSEKINSFGSTTDSESRDHSRTLAQFSFQGARATPIAVGVSREPLLDLSSSVAIKFGGTEDSVIFGTNGFGETSSSPTSTSAGGSHRFSSRGRHSESRFTITDQPTSFSARNLKDGTASDRGVGPATFFKENSGSVSTSASLAEPIEFGSEGSFPSTSGRESSPAVSLKVATDSSGSNRLRGHFTHGEKTSPVLEDQEELRSILHRGTGAEFAATNSGGIGSLFDRGSSVAQTKDTPGRSIATSASSSAGSFEGFSLKGLRGVSATSQGSVSERLPVESSSVSPTLAATGRVGRLSIGDFNSGNTGKISTGGSSVTSISVHKSGSNIFSAEGSDIISASNNQENVKDVSNTFNVASTSTATDGLRISSGDSNAVANSRGRISNRDSQAVTNSRGRISNGDSQAVTNSRARISNRDSQALTNSRGRISNRDSQAVTNSRGRISNRDSQAVATVRGNGGGTFINTESDAASTLIGNRQLSSHSFRKLGTISASTDRGKPNRLSVEDSDLSNSARRLGGLLAGSSGLSTGRGSSRISAGQSTVASTSSRGGSFETFSGSTSSSGSGAEEVLKTNDDSVTVIGNALNRLPAKNSKTISASRRFPIRSTTASVGESGGFSKRGPGSTATFSNDLSPGELSVRNSGSKTTVEGHSQAPPNTQIFITHTDAVDGNSKNSDTAGGFSFKGLRDATASSQGSVSEGLSGTGRVGKLSAGDFIADSELANSGEIGKISIKHSGTTSVSDHDSGSGKFSIRGSDVTFGSANQERIIDLSTGSNLASTSTVSDGLRFSNGGSHAAAATSTGIGGISFVNIQTDASHTSLGNEGLGSFSLGRLGTTTAPSDTGKFSRLSAKGFGNSEGFRGLSAGSSGQPPEPAGGRSVEISARESTAASSIQDGSLGRFSVSSSRSTSGTENDLKNNLAFNSVVGDASKGSTSTNAGSFSTQGSTANSGGQFGVFSRRGPGVRAPFNSELSLGGLSVGSPTSQSSVEGPSKGSPNIPIVITHSEAFNGNDKISAGSNAGERQPSVSSHLKGPFSLSKAIDTGTIIATTPNSEFTSTGELASENASGLGENVVARPSALSNSFGDVTITHARQGLSSTSGSGLSGTSGSGLFLSAATEPSFNHRGPGSINESNNDSKFARSGLDTHARTRFEENSGVSKISSTGTNASKGASVSTGLRCKNRFKNQAAKILEASQTTTKTTSIIKPKTNLLPSRQRSHSGVITTQNGDASTTTQSGDDSSKGSSTVSDSRTFSHGPLTTQVSARSLIGQPVLVPIKSALSSTSTSTATASTANASPTVVTTGIGKSNAQEVTPQSSSSSTSHSSQSAHTVPHFGGTSTTNLSKVSASRTFSSLAEATGASNPITNESAAFNKRTGTTGTTIQSDGNTPVPHFTISINSAPSKQLGSSTSSFISTDEEVSQPKTAGQPIRGAFSSASTSTGASPAAPFSTHASVGSESAKGGVSSPSIVLPTSSDGPAPSRALSRVNFASIGDSAGAAVPGSSSTATSSTVNLGPQEIVQHSLFPTATTSAPTSTRDSTASAPAASLSSGDATTVRGRTRVPVRTDHSSSSSSSIGSSQSSTVPHFGGAFPSDLPQSSASSSSSITTARDDVSHSIKSSLFPTLSASTVTGTTSTLPFESTFSSRSNTDVVPETGFSASHSSASLITPSSSPINKGSHSSSFSTTDSSNTSFSSTSSFSPNIQRVLQLVNLGQPAFIPTASALISTRDQPSETAQSSLSKATTSTGSSQSINLVSHFSSTSTSGLSKTKNSNSISSPRSNPVTIIQSPSISALSSTGTSSKVSSSGSKLPSKVSGTTSTTLVPEERIPVSSSFVFSKPPGSSSKEFTSSASSGTSKDNKVLQLPISHPVHIPLVSTLTSKEASTTSGSARASERAGSKHKNALVSRIGLVSDGDLSVAPASSFSSSTAATKNTIAPQAVSQSAKVLVTGSSSALPTSSRNTMAESLQASSSSAASSATSASTGTSASTNTRDSGNSVDSSVRESTISLSDRQAHIGNVINFATAGGARFFGTGHPPTIPTVAIPIVTSGALVEPRLGSAGTFGSNTPVFLANTVQASTPVIHSVPTTFLTGGHSNHPVVHGQNLALSSPLSIFSVPSHQIIGIDAVQG